ncbi:uncharacterized protein LOC111276700 isoform X2 [Durio zibethinus]|uniref:Bifunctional lysine-specific demethylase and histidyl-hydroxylase n=1 Tax=Durio zibethinus TaxID=66656 RepID=A0A6P5WQ81_DURZI|nr:uncharacterized protein LOC111276700 isoform X2 [Durio zibethinus]
MKQIKFHEKIEKFSFVSLAFPPVVFTWLPSSHLGSRRNLNLAEMEAKEEKEKERNSGKRKRRGFSPSHSDGNTVIFPLLLAAALSRSNTHTTLVKKCLTKFLSHGQPIPTPFLSLCPLLLNSKSPQIAILTARILGAASLMSFQMNQQVVSDSPTLKALISLMPPSHKNMIVSMAACDALLDLCSTCVARHRLLHFSALETLMFAFLQVRRSSILISLGTGDDVNIASLRIVFQRGELPVLLLSAAIILINTCNIEQLRKIPSKLSECFSVFLKEVWKEAHKQMLKGNILGPGQGMSLYFSSVTINNLAESIFRLSINVDQFPALMPSEMVKRRIFCFSEDDFKRFILSQWEVLPCVVRRFSTASLEAEEIFASLMQTLCSKEFFPSALSSILQGLTSCLPIDSDELDILSFLTEVRNKLGCPLINEQDIRVLRTDNQLKQEVRFFEENVDSCFVKAPQILCADDILKFEEAYNKGYTIALRGMEFRFENFALIADGLASVFGQPSAGANLYLTPPNSQGLARHYDDHCVFVCQIFGSKQWKIFSQPNVQLPRLYDPCNIQNGEGIDNSRADCYHFLLNEGDVLYIPRGFPHEACTHYSSPDGSAGLSLHLTLGIEVEPPFEWEGFMQVALFYWNHTQHQHHLSLKSLSGILNAMSVKLLHIVIGLISDSDPTFRKACLVAAASLESDANNWLDLCQKTIFSNLIEKINRESRFLEALKSVEVAIQRNEDPFQRIRWLRSLNQEGESVEGCEWVVAPSGVQDIFRLYVEYKEMAETVFMEVKSKFCSQDICFCGEAMTSSVISFLQERSKKKKKKK